MGIPYLIGASNIINGEIRCIRWTEYPQVVSQVGDILVSCKGTIGEIVENKVGDIHIARQFMAVRPSDCLYNRFLSLFLNNAVVQIKKQARGVIPGISREDLLNLSVPLPPLAEQQRIVEAIEAAFAALDAIQAQIKA